MTIDNFPSRLLENAVNEFAKLPGIGKKTALRLVLHLLKKDVEEVQRFSRALTQLREEVNHCKICRNISDTDVCNICSNPSRDHRTVCVVENIRDVMSIENYPAIQGRISCFGGNYFTDGWNWSCRPRNRFAVKKDRKRGDRRGDFCVKVQRWKEIVPISTSSKK